MKFFYLFIIVGVFIFTSCKKDIPIEDIVATKELSTAQKVSGKYHCVGYEKGEYYNDSSSIPEKHYREIDTILYVEQIDSITIKLWHYQLSATHPHNRYFRYSQCQYCGIEFFPDSTLNQFEFNYLNPSPNSASWFSIYLEGEKI